MASLIDDDPASEPRPARIGRGRARSSMMRPGRGIARDLAAGRWTMLEPVGRNGRRAHGAVRREDRRYRVSSACECRAWSAFPRSARFIRPRSGSSARSAISTGSSRPACGTCARGSISACWDVMQPLGPNPRRSAVDRAVRLPAGRRREPAPDRGRAGACRHHRARPFPLHRQWRDGRAAGAAPRLCAQGHRRR